MGLLNSIIEQLRTEPYRAVLGVLQIVKSLATVHTVRHCPGRVARHRHSLAMLVWLAATQLVSRIIA